MSQQQNDEERQIGRETLKVIDTKDNLTVEELREIKRLVAASRAVKLVMVFAMSLVMIIGFDRIMSFFVRH